MDRKTFFSWWIRFPPQVRVPPCGCLFIMYSILLSRHVSDLWEFVFFYLVTSSATCCYMVGGKPGPRDSRKSKPPALHPPPLCKSIHVPVKSHMHFWFLVCCSFYYDSNCLNSFNHYLKTRMRQQRWSLERPGAWRKRILFLCGAASLRGMHSRFIGRLSQPLLLSSKRFSQCCVGIEAVATSHVACHGSSHRCETRFSMILRWSAHDEQKYQRFLYD